MSKTIEDLDSYLKQFNLRNALIQLGNFSIKLFKERKAFDSFPIRVGVIPRKVTIAQWNLAFLAYRLIMSSNEGKRKNLEYKEVLLANSIHAQFDEALSREQDLLLFFSRISQQQLWWQENQMTYLSRNYLLLNEVSKDIKFENRINLDKLFYEEYGLSIYEYMVVGFAIFSVVHTNPTFNKSNLLNHSIPQLEGILTENKLDRFIALVSTDYDSFRRISREVNEVSLSGYEQYQFNPLFRYPIIESDPRFQESYTIAPYIVPNILLLLRKLCDGLYWKLRDLFKDSDSREFLSLFGDIFELYVGRQLSRFSKKCEIYLLPKEEASKKGRKIADWLLVEDNIVIIIECKSQLFPQGLRETFDEGVLKAWLDRNVVKGVEQLYSSEDLLRTQSLNSLKEVNISGKKIVKVVVTNEHIYHAESKLFKDKIKEQVEELEVLMRCPSAQEGFYIMHISELEFLENILKKYSLEDVFSKKDELDEKESLRESNDFMATFLSMDNDIKFSNTWLDETQKNFFNTIIPIR